MAIHVHRNHTVACDFCTATHGRIGDYQSASAARLGAIAAGWKLVPIRLSGGGRAKPIDPTDSKRLATASTNNRDACPACPPCKSCMANPPAGFTCNSCGAGA